VSLLSKRFAAAAANDDDDDDDCVPHRTVYDCRCVNKSLSWWVSVLHNQAHSSVAWIGPAFMSFTNCRGSGLRPVFQWGSGADVPWWGRARRNPPEAEDCFAP